MGDLFGIVRGFLNSVISIASTKCKEKCFTFLILLYKKSPSALAHFSTMLRPGILQNAFFEAFARRPGSFLLIFCHGAASYSFDIPLVPIALPFKQVNIDDSHSSRQL